MVIGKPTEPGDPYELVEVTLPSPPGYDATAEMALCFVEEFALMGWSAKRILRLFQNPHYAGAYMIFHDRGEEFVKGLIAQVVGPAETKEEGHG